MGAIFSWLAVRGLGVSPRRRAEIPRGLCGPLARPGLMGPLATRRAGRAKELLATGTCGCGCQSCSVWSSPCERYGNRCHKCLAVVLDWLKSGLRHCRSSGTRTRWQLMPRAGLQFRRLHAEWQLMPGGVAAKPSAWRPAPGATLVGVAVASRAWQLVPRAWQLVPPAWPYYGWQLMPERLALHAGFGI